MVFFSGASSYMCFYEEKFEDIGRKNTLSLNLGSSESTSIGGVGYVKMEIDQDFSANIQKTIYVSYLRFNLLSVANITDN